MNPELPINDVLASENYLSTVWPPMVQAVATGWLFVFGASFGSFFNVVVYRLPRGINLSVPGSHCPNCKHPIRWHDNIPVLGWLKLRGRCRDCHTPFSARYPLIEALVGALFALVAWLDVFWPQARVPTLDVESQWFRYLADLVLLSTLLCAGLIQYDRQPAPLKLFVVALLCLALPFALSGVRALPFNWPSAARLDYDSAWFASLVGAQCGAVEGAAAWLLFLKGATQFRQSVVVAELALAGAYFGWQGVTAVALVAGLVALATWLMMKRHAWPRAWSLGVAAGALFWIAARCWILIDTMNT